MNEFNCNSLKNLPVPDALIQKALAIPESVEKAPAVLPWYRRTKVIAAAASFLLVVTLGFTAYFLFGNINKNVLPVAPKPGTAVTPAASEAPTEHSASPINPTAPTENGTVAPTERGTVPPNTTTNPTEHGVIPTDASVARPTENRTPAATSAHEPRAERGTQPSRDPASRPTSPSPTSPLSTTPRVIPATESPSRTPRATERPAVTPTRVPTEPPHPQPTSAPHTQKPTTAPVVPQQDLTVEPSDPPWEVSTESPKPWEKVTEPPTDASALRPTDAALTFRTQINTKNKLYHGTLYCRIYDRTAKKVLGDPDRFAASHRATCTAEGAYVHAAYCPSKHGITLPPGKYAIGFYNENGEFLINYYYTVY